MKINSSERVVIEKYSIVSFILCSFGLLTLWGYYAFSSVPILTELGDEYEYLWNAVHIMSGELPDIYTSYYGIGYSVFLIVPYLFTQGGSAFVFCSYLVNMFFAYGVFIILVILLARINLRINWKTSICSMIACLSPVLSANVCKVMCENCLAFFMALSVLLFYEFVCSRKIVFSIFCSISVAYMYLIHTRSVGIVFCFCVFFAFFCIKNRISFLQTITPISILILFLTVFYFFKLNILQDKQELLASKEIANVISKSLVEKWLMWFLKDFKNYLCAFLCKLLYVYIATCGLLIIWPFYRIREVVRCVKEKDALSNKEFFFLYILGCFFVIMVETTLVGTGETIPYMFYGRYYEFTIPTMLGIMLDSCDFNDTRINRKRVLFYIFGIFMSVKISIVWALSEYEHNLVKIDTNRIDALSVILNEGKDSIVLLFTLGVVMLFFMLLFFYGEKNVFFAVAFAFLLWSSCVNLSEVNRVHSAGKRDYELAQYIKENVNEKIWVIDDDSYKYSKFFSRMLVYLNKNDYEIVEWNGVIDKTNALIEKGDFYMVYSSSQNIDTIVGGEIIREGLTMNLYKK